MGRGKRQATISRERQPTLGTSDGRTRLQPRISPPEPEYSAVEETALFVQLEDAGIPEANLSIKERTRLLDLFVDAEGDQETRIIDAVDLFTDELIENEEETETCDRCSKIVRAGNGNAFPPEDDDHDLADDIDQERLCQDCFDKALVGYEDDLRLLRKYGASGN